MASLLLQVLQQFLFLLETVWILYLTIGLVMGSVMMKQIKWNATMMVVTAVDQMPIMIFAHNVFALNLEEGSTLLHYITCCS